MSTETPTREDCLARIAEGAAEIPAACADIIAREGPVFNERAEVAVLLFGLLGLLVALYFVNESSAARRARRKALRAEHERGEGGA